MQLVLYFISPDTLCRTPSRTSSSHLPPSPYFLRLYFSRSFFVFLPRPVFAHSFRLTWLLILKGVIVSPPAIANGKNGGFGMEKGRASCGGTTLFSFLVPRVALGSTSSSSTPANRAQCSSQRRVPYVSISSYPFLWLTGSVGRYPKQADHIPWRYSPQ